MPPKYDLDKIKYATNAPTFEKEKKQTRTLFNL